MSYQVSRRQLIRDLGLSAAAMPFVLNFPSLGFSSEAPRKKRLIIMFSPNGVVPWTFWPDETGRQFGLKESLSPLDPYKERSLILKGVNINVHGHGDDHMRGIGCLLTGVELFPGNFQGGGNSPAGWSTGLSIDQEIKNHLQKDPATRTRFGSLEFGVLVPGRADTFSRMSYADANRPLTPIDDPYQMFKKLYGRMADRDSVKSVMDDLLEDMTKLRAQLSEQDRQLLEEHTDWVRDFERELVAGEESENAGHVIPDLEMNVDNKNDNMPLISKMQIDLIVNSLVADFARVITLQYNKSVGEAQMNWLGVEGRHHSLSHHGDDDEKAQNDLTKINKWYCEQLVSLVKKLDETPEPDGRGSLLDNTLVIWTNELGKGNSHTRNDIPFVLVGGGLDYDMGRSLQFSGVNHNRLLMSLAHGFGHHIKSFGDPNLCGEGELSLA